MDLEQSNRLIDLLESLNETLQNIDESLEAMEAMKRCQFFCDKVPTIDHVSLCHFSNTEETN